MKLFEEAVRVTEEQGLGYPKDEARFEPPKAAQKNAQKVIDWKEEHGRDEVEGMTKTGWARAHQLADGEEISFNVLKRMYRFKRHRKNAKISDEHKDKPWKDKGYVAWLGWGGDEGIEWAEKVYDRESKKMEESVLAEGEDHVSIPEAIKIIRKPGHSVYVSAQVTVGGDPIWVKVVQRDLIDQLKRIYKHSSDVRVGIDVSNRDVYVSSYGF